MLRRGLDLFHPELLNGSNEPERNKQLGGIKEHEEEQKPRSAARKSEQNLLKR